MVYLQTKVRKFNIKIMKKTLIILVLLPLFTFSQTSNLLTKLKELFFDLPLKVSKYEVRKKFNSDNNFYEFSDDNIYTCISAKYLKNYMHSSSKILIQEIHIWFKNDMSDSRRIGIKYSKENEMSGKYQYDELCQIFAKVSYKNKTFDTYNGKNVYCGVTTNYYSSENKYKTKKEFLSITYRTMYYPAEDYYYWLTIELFDNNVK